MVHKIAKQKSEIVEWGFDLTDVKSDEAFLKLLDKYGFKLVESKTPDEELLKGSGITGRKMFGERFTKFHPLWKNAQGIKIRTEHIGGKEEDKGALGYIGIKAPRKALPVLKAFLKDFRGSSSIKTLDWSGNRGVVKYVKQESPYKSRYIGVDVAGS